MKRNIWIWLVLVCINGLAVAQTQQPQFPVNVRTWDEGKLNWSDFQIRPAENGVTSNLEYFIWTRTEKTHFDTLKNAGTTSGNILKNANVYRSRAYACVDTDSSWVSDSFKKEAHLRYNQVLFDIFALQVKKSQTDLDRSPNKSEKLDSLFGRVMDSTFVQAEQYRISSNFGNDVSVTDSMEKVLNLQLQTISSGFPAYSERKFGLGAHAGVCGDLFTGSLGEHFTPIAGITLGLDFAYGRSVLTFNGNVDYLHFRKPYYTHQTWTSGNKYELFQGDIDYGFIVYDGFSWKCMPFAGVGMSEISNVNSNDGEDKLKMSTVVWKAGICLDYKLLNNLSYVSRDLQTFSLQGKIYVSYANYYDDMNGLTLNLSLSANIFDRFISPWEKAKKGSH